MPTSVKPKQGQLLRLDEPPPAPGRWRRLLAFMCLTVLGGGPLMSIMAFIPLYLVDQFGASEQTAASLLSIIFSARPWAGPLGGYLSNRIGRVPIIIACSLIGGILVYLLKVTPLWSGFQCCIIFYRYKQCSPHASVIGFYHGPNDGM